MDTVVTDKTYTITFDIQGGDLIQFTAEFTQARIYGSKTWKPLDDFDFHQIIAEDNVPFMQFRTSVVFLSEDEEDGDEWKKKEDDPDVKERPVIYTIKTGRLASLRVVYEN